VIAWTLQQLQPEVAQKSRNGSLQAHQHRQQCRHDTSSNMSARHPARTKMICSSSPVQLR
jgi:hypothetical protein